LPIKELDRDEFLTAERPDNLKGQRRKGIISETTTLRAKEKSAGPKGLLHMRTNTENGMGKKRRTELQGKNEAPGELQHRMMEK